ncbi:MAG: hypothetical protein A3F17_04290 [Gammaproteobacteria bacterium RIFCSPHIGHO2_12_FULL_41_15]|nr:MAG: hypothetical protein A3F17_04290 [Gammaproteobacteria bacterium RIFCSPHIGHO2_12_FULL_41_15]
MTSITVELHEKQTYDFITVDQENNVHVWMPMVGGNSIALETTCRAVSELAIFWGKKQEHARPSCLKSLERYRDDLRFDISKLAMNAEANSALRRSKTQRLEQIENYIALIRQLKDAQDLSAVSSGMCHYPASVLRLLDKKSNVLSMKLSPRFEDNFTNVSSPAYRATRNDSGTTLYRNSLGHFLRTHFQQFIARVASRPSNAIITKRNFILAEIERHFGAGEISAAEVFTRTAPQTNGQPVTLQTLLQTLVRDRCESCEQLSFEEDSSGLPIDESYFSDTLGLDFVTPREFAETFINACFAETTRQTSVDIPMSGAVSADPFLKIQLDTSATAGGDRYNQVEFIERLSVMTQFFLAEINLFCFAHNLSTRNFAAVFDADPNLQATAANIVLDHISRNESPVMSLLNMIEAKMSAFSLGSNNFGLKRKLTPADKEAIIARFSADYNQVKDAPHFDEFLLFFSSWAVTSTVPDFVTLNGRMSCHLGTYVSAAQPALLQQNQFLRHHLDVAQRRSSHELNHQNTTVEQSVFTMDTEALYQQLNGGYIQELTEVLLSTATTVAASLRKVFQSLDPFERQRMMQSPRWSSLNTCVLARIQHLTISPPQKTRLTADWQEAFSPEVAALQAPDRVFVLTERIVNKLKMRVLEFFQMDEYHRLFASGNDIQSIAKALGKFLGLDDLRGLSKIEGSGDFQLSLNPSFRFFEKLKELIESLDAAKSTIHITLEMEAHLYAAVYETASPEENARLHSLDDSQEKIKRALELLNIRFDLTPSDRDTLVKNDGNGFIFHSTEDNIAQLLAIQERQRLTWITPNQARCLYQALVTKAPLESDNLVFLCNAGAPEKIGYTLEKLGIPFSELIFNGENGYRARLTDDAKRMIQDIELSWQSTQPEAESTEARSLVLSRKVAMSLYREVEMQLKARGRNEVLQAFNEKNNRGAISGSKIEMALALLNVQTEQLGFHDRDGFKIVLEAPAIQAIRAIHSRQQSLLANRRVIVHDRILRSSLTDAQIAELQNPSVTIFAPEWVREILGAITPELEGVVLQYPDGHEEILKHPISLNQLLLLARNEESNVTGAIAFGQYVGLSRETIYTIKDLARQVVVIGVTSATHFGGYPQGARTERFQERVVICDSIGLQFQEAYNSGRLCLISEKSNHIGRCDDLFFKHIVGEQKALYHDCRSDRSGRYQSVSAFEENHYFDVKAYQHFIANDLLIAANGINQVALEQSIPSVHFKFLQQGTGFFAGELRPLVQANIAQGILLGLEKLFSGNPESCNKIKSIELPYFPNNPILKEPIERLCASHSIQLTFGCNDALNPVDIPDRQRVLASTNCGDGHVQPCGNEMGFSSVDAAMASNLRFLGNDFSLLLNRRIREQYTLQASANVAGADTSVAADAAPAAAVVASVSAVGNGNAAAASAENYRGVSNFPGRTLAPQAEARSGPVERGREGDVAAVVARVPAVENAAASAGSYRGGASIFSDSAASSMASEPSDAQRIQTLRNVYEANGGGWISTRSIFVAGEPTLETVRARLRGHAKKNPRGAASMVVNSPLFKDQVAVPAVRSDGVAVGRDASNSSSGYRRG